MKTIAIMQPYLFPYIGYFQLIEAADVFVIYDNVQYIKRGWINRNQILLQGKSQFFVLPVQKNSQGTPINRTFFSEDCEVAKQKTLETIRRAYLHAPYFKKSFPVLEEVFNCNERNVSRLAEMSIRRVLEYLNIDIQIYCASEVNHDKNLRGEDKILCLVKALEGDKYINPIGGIELYSPEWFWQCGIELKFLRSKVSPYKQYDKPFVPNLSIIDVMMFNTVEEIQQMLKEYELI
jgi:hypothetical protein